MMQISNDGKKIDRKTVEKNRRTHMKKLCFKLNSLVPSLSSQPFKLFTQESQFDHSIAYIEHLRKRIEVLKDKRNEALKYVNDYPSALSCEGVSTPPSTVEVHDLDGGLKVLLISNTEKKILFSEIISIVEEGGAEVVKGGYTTADDDKVIYTLHAKADAKLLSSRGSYWKQSLYSYGVEARVTRIGIEVESVHQKLLELINRSS